MASDSDSEEDSEEDIEQPKEVVLMYKGDSLSKHGGQKLMVSSRVAHDKYGFGMVQSVEGDIPYIFFDDKRVTTVRHTRTHAHTHTRVSLRP